MATLAEAASPTSAARSARDTRIWLSEYGYQTNPPDRLPRRLEAKQAQYLDEAALRAYRAPRVDMLIQYLVQDEPDLGGWQSGLLTAAGVPKPSYAAFALPLAVEQRSRREGDAVGPDPPRRRTRRTTCSRSSAPAAWTPVGGPARTRHARASSSARSRPSPGRASASSSSRATSRARRSRAEERLDARPAGASAGGRSSRHVQSRGSLSSRQRISFVPWRKRLPCTLS